MANYLKFWNGFRDCKYEYEKIREIDFGLIGYLSNCYVITLQNPKLIYGSTSTYDNFKTRCFVISKKDETFRICNDGITYTLSDIQKLILYVENKNLGELFDHLS